MRNTIVRLGAALLGIAAAAFPQTIDEVRPGCAAPGDAVLIRGADFGREPTVLFGTTEAEIVRSSEKRIVCRVPRDLPEGDVTIDVDGATAPFHVLAKGAPAIVHISATTATPGMPIFLVGARLEGATADFEDEGGATAASVALKGGFRVAYLKVPIDLLPGTYTLRISNGNGDSGPCSPVLEIVEPGEPTLLSIEPAEQVPGRDILCKGTDLGPLGFCFLTWTDGDGNELFNFGFANGYDRVHSWVPFEATGGETYDVVIDFADGGTTAATGALPYTVGTLPPPEITELQYDKGPPGSLVGIRGRNLVGPGFAAWPTVEFTRDGVSTEAFVFFFHGRHHGKDDTDELIVEVPRSLEDGEYDVTVTVAGQTSNAVPFTVGALPLTVTSMRPDGQSTRGPEDVVVIEGTGFGVPDYDVVVPDKGGGGTGGSRLAFHGADPSDPFRDIFKVKVTWQAEGDAEPREGEVIWHTDREILVIPPGGWQDPLPLGEYTVVVTVDRGGGETESVEAGIYTVHEATGGGGWHDKPLPMPGMR